MKPLDVRREWVLANGRRYWPGTAVAIAALPMPRVMLGDDAAGKPMQIALPEWAADIAVDGKLLAFAGCFAEAPGGSDWMRCDWLAVCWHMLTGSAERAHEARHGPILSYSFRLPGELRPLFERAWVNRVFMFLRRWAAREQGEAEDELFGPTPQASILLTHDVDAIALTPEIRAKQAAFQLANAAHAAAHLKPAAAGSRLTAAARYAFSMPDLRTLARMRDMEHAAGLRSLFHFYGGASGLARGSLRRILIDPAYDVGSSYLRGEIRALLDGGWQVGLHQSFDAWAEPAAMQAERQRVEMVAGQPVTHCRQHWLRFSWAKTWAAQQQAGLAADSTLGFNDRAGFRAGHALRINPWDFEAHTPMRLEAVPTLFMDSHFHDYAEIEAGEVASAMKGWLDEVRAVGGEATVNWHPHTITGLYGWGRGYEDLLGMLRR